MNRTHHTKSFSQAALSFVLAFATLFVVSMVTASPNTAHAADMKVGVVDFSRALAVTEKDGALADLKKEAERRRKALAKLEQEVVDIETELQENGPMLSEEKMKERLMVYQQKALEYRKAAFSSEQEFLDEKQTVLQKIHEEMQIICVEIAQDKGLDFMVEKNEGAVIYFNASFDYTDELIKRYSAKKN